jgi:hypothetical protein
MMAPRRPGARRMPAHTTSATASGMSTSANGWAKRKLSMVRRNHRYAAPAGTNTAAISPYGIGPRRGGSRGT